MTPEEKYLSMIREARRHAAAITVERQCGNAVLRYYAGNTYKWFRADGGRDITNSLKKSEVIALIAKALAEEERS